MSTKCSIEHVSTHAEPDAKGELVQWVEVRLLLPKSFDFEAGSAELLKRLKHAVGLIGRRDA